MKGVVILALLFVLLSSCVAQAYASMVSSPDVVHRTLTSPNAQTNGGFGLTVAITGKIVVVGAAGETVNGLIQAGNAYIS